MQHAFAVTIVAWLLLAWQPPAGTSPMPTRNGTAPANMSSAEELKPDAAWCGPRVVYFFARYLDKPYSMDAIVSACRTDAEGYTTVANLVEAADQLGLEPTAVDLPPEQILELDGPAILCVRKAFPSTDPSKSDPDARLHFIGLVKRDGDRFWVLDPSRDASLIAYRGDRLAAVVTGQVVLLRGCNVPALQVGWLTFPYVLVPSAVVVMSLACLVSYQRGRKKPLKAFGKNDAQVETVQPC